MAGGILTGGGFAAGRLLDGSPPVTAEASAGDPPAAVEAPPVDTVPVVQIPSDPGREPATVVAEVLGPSIVQLETTAGTGSGVVYDDGLIITNHHVVGDATSVVVQVGDGRRLAGEVVGREPEVDIAVVSVGPDHGLPIASLALDERPEVGQTAIVIGSPFRLQQTVTQGIVSGIDRPVQIGDAYTAMIQTDAPINPGNSGGALADRTGRVIGIVTLIQADIVSNDNAVGFAVPIGTAIRVADRIVAGLPFEAGFLGVSGDVAGDGAAGLSVTSVTPGSAAEVAGIEVGDLIVAIDGAPVTAFEELAGLVAARRPGEVVVVELIRDGELLAVDATLDARPG